MAHLPMPQAVRDRLTDVRIDVVIANQVNLESRAARRVTLNPGEGHWEGAFSITELGSDSPEMRELRLASEIDTWVQSLEVAQNTFDLPLTRYNIPEPITLSRPMLQQDGLLWMNVVGDTPDLEFGMHLVIDGRLYSLGAVEEDRVRLTPQRALAGTGNLSATPALLMRGRRVVRSARGEGVVEWTKSVRGPWRIDFKEAV